MSPAGDGGSPAEQREPAADGPAATLVLPSDLTLDTPLAALMGARAAKPFASTLRLETVDDLLWHLPRRYAKRGELTAMSELPLGEHVSLVAEVRRVEERRMRSRGGSILEVLITDGRGYVTLTFFNQAWRRRTLVVGADLPLGMLTSIVGGPIFFWLLIRSDRSVKH